MPFTLPALKDLAAEKGEILSLAAQALPTILHTDQDPVARARIAAFKSLQEHIRDYLHQHIEPAIQNVIDTHEVMEGERSDAADPAAWDAAVDAAVAAELAAVRVLNANGFDKFAQNVRWDEAGTVASVSKTLATFVGGTEPYTAPMTDIGKLLSKVGIVKADIETLAKLAPAPGTPAPAATPAPAPAGTPTSAAVPPSPAVLPPPAALPPPDIQGAAALLTHRAPPPPAEETSVEIPDAIDMRPPPGTAEIAQAYALMYQAAGPDANDMAQRLGCSRNTFVNWCTGKTPPKCNVDQARFLAAYCTKAAADINAAFDIFSRVR